MMIKTAGPSAEWRRPGHTIGLSAIASAVSKDEVLDRVVRPTGPRYEVVDVSATGAKIAWVGETRLTKGTILKGALQWGKGKVLPVDAIVIHSPLKGTFGLRFVNLNTSIQNRLKMLVIEIQQTIHFK